MNSPKVFTGIILVLMSFPLTSCTRHYFDTVKHQSEQPVVKDSYFHIFYDSIVFRYKSNVVLSRDSEKIYPRAFTVKLPRKLKSYSISASTDFSFFYDNNQVIIIKIDLEDLVAGGDSVSEQSEHQMEDFIESGTSLNGNYDLRKISFDKKKKHLLIKKGGAKIVLYNIEPKNIQLFSEYVKGLRFMDK